MPIRTTNRNVTKQWAKGIGAQSHNGQLSTNGEDLYSYNKIIGITLDDGTKVALEYRSTKGGHYISNTTSTHVGYAAYEANLTMTPDAAKEADLIGRV